MKKKRIAFITLLPIVALLLASCASGLTPGAWPAMTADAQNVYVSAGQFVYAVDLAKGTQAWAFPEKASANPFYAKPALSPDGKQLIVGGFDKKLYSIDPATGKSTWQFTQAHDRWFGGALVTDSAIYAGNADYNLYALDLNGNLKWEFLADQSIWGSPVTDGTNIYFGSLGSKVYAVNAKTGNQAWMTEVDGAVLGNPALGKDGTLYVGTYHGKVYAINTADGKSTELMTTKSWIWDGPTVDDTTLYVGDAAGYVYGVSLSEAGQTWQLTDPLDGAIIGSPVIQGQNLFIGTEAGKLYSIGLDGKNVQSLIASIGKIYASPVVAGDAILVAPTDGTFIVNAYDAAGKDKWNAPFTKPK